VRRNSGQENAKCKSSIGRGRPGAGMPFKKRAGKLIRKSVFGSGKMRRTLKKYAIDKRLRKKRLERGQARAQGKRSAFKGANRRVQ